jgi:hypothetical protein
MLKPATASGNRHLPVEELPVLRHKVTNVRCGPSDDCLDIMRETIITVSSMEACHGQKVFRDMVGQVLPTQYLVTPLIERHVDVPDRPLERLGIFGCDAVHILRSRPGQLVEVASFENGMKVALKIMHPWRFYSNLLSAASAVDLCFLGERRRSTFRLTLAARPTLHISAIA